MRTITLSLFCAIFSFNGICQQTDKVSFYILYDLSGSMRADVYDNSKFVLNRILSKSKRTSEYEIFLIGDSQVQNKDLKQDFSNERKADEKIEAVINQFYPRRGNIKYTDILTSLNEVKSALNSREQVFMILISDLRLLNDDIPEKINSEIVDKQEYRNGTRDIIKELSKQAVLHVIQPANQSYDEFFEVEPKHIDTEGRDFFISESKRYMYINNDLEVEGNEEIEKKVEDFINDIIQSTISFIPEPKGNNIPDGILSTTKMSYLIANSSLISARQNEIKAKSDQNMLGFGNKLDNITKEILDTDKISESSLTEIRNLIKEYSKKENYEFVSEEVTQVIEAQWSIEPEKAKVLEIIELDANSLSLTSIPQEVNESITNQNFEEALINGLADYLLERFEKELIFIFYEEMNERLFSRNAFVRDTLFFNAYRTLNNLENYPSIPHIKEALNSDLRNLPENLLMHPNATKSPSLTYLKYSYYLFEGLYKNENLDDVIARFGELARSNQSGRVFTDFELGILFISEYFSLLRQKDFAEILNRPLDNQSRILLTSILSAHITEKLGVTQIKDLNQLTDKIFKLNETIKTIKSQIERINDELKSVPKENILEYEEFKRRKVISTLRLSSDILKESISLINHFSKQEISPYEILEYTRKAENILNAYFDIRDRKYVEAATVLVPVISEISILDKDHSFIQRGKKKIFFIFPYGSEQYKIRRFPKGVSTISELIDEAAVSFEKFKNDFDGKTKSFKNYEEYTEFLSSHSIDFLRAVIKPTLGGGTMSVKFENAILGDVEKVLVALKNLDTSLDELKNQNEVLDYKTLKNFISSIKDSEVENLDRVAYYFLSSNDIDHRLKKLIEFSSEISEVMNSTDVKNVLSNYALPVASYRAKRKEPNTLMLNAYLGIGGSFYTGDNDIRGTVIAPIGIEYSRNGIKNTYFTERGRLSYSIMLTMLDVGNIVNYRINEDDEEREVKFEQVLSPGLLFNIGLSRKYPLALGFGYQFNPNRLTASLSFDLPLFRIR